VKFKFLKMRMKTLSNGVAGALDSRVCNWIFFNGVHFQDFMGGSFEKKGNLLC
jgi:hypothetical protein